MFIKEPVKQRNILKATQKIENKDHANTNAKTEPTTGMNRGQRIKIENLQPGREETWGTAGMSRACNCGHLFYILLHLP